MTLTIPDVEKWQPDQLTTAGIRANTISRSLDTAVGKGSTDTRELADSHKWSGAAGTAANTRMDTEKTRASPVSAALLELETAFTTHVANLVGTKATVLQLRDDAINQNPPFGVAPNGTVDAKARIDLLRSHSDKADMQGLILQESLAAASRTWNLTNALKAAEDAANLANTAVRNAVTKLQAAFDGLGEPKSENPPPAVTTVASTNSGPQISGSNSGYTSGGSNPGRTSEGSQYSDNSSSGSPSSTPHQGPGSHAPTGPMPTGDMAQWIAEAKEKLIEMGYDPKDIDERAIAMIIEHESAGNPHAENLWDSNYLAGHPSKGLMQTIDGTFDAYKAPGHDDIWNPVDNIIAGTRYSLDRYGSLADVPGVAAVNSGGAYQGY